MMKKIICTNNRCEKCDDFLIFEVRDLNQNRNGNKILYGIWICTICKEKTSGLWFGINRKEFQFPTRKREILSTSRVLH